MCSGEHQGALERVHISNTVLALVLASGAYESRRHKGSAESTVVVRDANDGVLSEGAQEVTSTLAQSAEAVRPGSVRFRTCVSNVAAHGSCGINRTS